MKSIILLVTLVLSLNVFASGNHYHPKKILKCATLCTENQIKDVVPEALDVLIKAREINESWRNIAVEKIEKKQFSKAEEWVVSFFNKSESNPSKQRLYMFISLDGWLNGANNTGN